MTVSCGLTSQICLIIALSLHCHYTPESDTQSILEKENTESYTLQDIGRSVQEYTDFTKTLVYCAVTGFAVWQVLCKTWKHVDKGTSPVPAGSTAAVPTAPVPTPTRPSLFKKTPDPFQMA